MAKATGVADNRSSFSSDLLTVSASQSTRFAIALPGIGQKDELLFQLLARLCATSSMFNWEVIGGAWAQTPGRPMAYLAGYASVVDAATIWALLTATVPEIDLKQTIDWSGIELIFDEDDTA